MSEHAPLTTGEFDRTMSAIREEIRLGFQRINGRLDKHGTALTEHGQQLARHDERLDDVEAKPGTTDAATLSISKPMAILLGGAFTGLQPLLLMLFRAMGWFQ